MLGITALHLETHARQIPVDVRRRDRITKYLRDAARSERDLTLLSGNRANVDWRAVHLSTTQGDDDLRYSLERLRGEVHVDAALEAIAGVGAHAEGFAG